MIRRPPRSTRTDTLFPYTTLFRSGVLLDRVADVAQGCARLHRADPAPHRLVRGIDQPPRHHRRLAGVVHAAGVAVPAVLDDGDVDVQDVAVLEHPRFVRDAVADDVVDRDAVGLGVTAVAEIGRALV